MSKESCKRKRERSEVLPNSSPESPINKVIKMTGLTLESLAQILDEKLKPIHAKLDLMDTLVKENKELRQRVALQDKRIDDLENEIGKLHLIARRNNLIFRNIKVNDGENAEIILKNIINSVMKIQIDGGLIRAFPVGKKRNKSGILAEFKSTEYIDQILKNSVLLKQNGISVSRDLPKAFADRENKLLAIRKEIRKTNCNKKITVRNGKMFFDDIVMEWDKHCGLTMEGSVQAVDKIKQVFNIDVSQLISKLTEENSA